MTVYTLFDGPGLGEALGYQADGFVNGEIFRAAVREVMVEDGFSASEVEAALAEDVEQLRVVRTEGADGAWFTACAEERCEECGAPGVDDPRAEWVTWLPLPSSL